MEELPLRQKYTRDFFLTPGSEYQKRMFHEDELLALSNTIKENVSRNYKC